MVEKRNTKPYTFAESAGINEDKLPKLVQADALKGWCADVMAAVGVSRKDAEVMAYSLVESDLMGVDTHGILKLPMYVSRAQKGGDNPKARLRVIQETATTARCDGEGGYGQIMGWRGMELAMEKEWGGICQHLQLQHIDLLPGLLPSGSRERIHRDLHYQRDPADGPSGRP